MAGFPQLLFTLSMLSKFIFSLQSSDNQMFVSNNISLFLGLNQSSLNKSQHNYQSKFLQSIFDNCTSYTTCQECFGHNGCVFYDGICNHYSNIPSLAGYPIFFSKYFEVAWMHRPPPIFQTSNVFNRYFSDQFIIDSEIDDYWWFNTLNFCPVISKCQQEQRVFLNLNNGFFNLTHNMNPSETCIWRIDNTGKGIQSLDDISDLISFKMERQGKGMDKLTIINCDFKCSIDIIHDFLKGTLNAIRMYRGTCPWCWSSHDNFLSSFDINNHISISFDEEISDSIQKVEVFKYKWIIYKYIGPNNLNNFKFSISSISLPDNNLNDNQYFAYVSLLVLFFIFSTNLAIINIGIVTYLVLRFYKSMNLICKGICSRVLSGNKFADTLKEVEKNVEKITL